MKVERINRLLALTLGTVFLRLQSYESRIFIYLSMLIKMIEFVCPETKLFPRPNKKRFSQKVFGENSCCYRTNKY